MTWPQQIPQRLLSALHLTSDQPLHGEADDAFELEENMGVHPAETPQAEPEAADPSEADPNDV